MTPGARAREFFTTYPPPDAAWYTDTVLIPGLAHLITEEREACAKAICLGCRSGSHVGTNVWGTTTYECQAAAIRALG